MIVLLAFGNNLQLLAGPIFIQPVFLVTPQTDLSFLVNHTVGDGGGRSPHAGAIFLKVIILLADFALIKAEIGLAVLYCGFVAVGEVCHEFLVGLAAFEHVPVYLAPSPLPIQIQPFIESWFSFIIKAFFALFAGVSCKAQAICFSEYTGTVIVSQVVFMTDFTERI